MPMVTSSTPPRHRLPLTGGAQTANATRSKDRGISERTAKVLTGCIGAINIGRGCVHCMTIRLRLFRLDYTSSRLQSDPLTWADVISKCTEGAAFLAEVQMSKLEKTAAANCKTLAHDAKQAFTADIIGRLEDMPPAEAAKYFGVSECAFV